MTKEIEAFLDAKGLSINKSIILSICRSASESFSAGRDHVVPVTVERVTGDVDGGQLHVGYLEPLGILSFIQFSSNFEAGVGCRCGDQLDDGAIAAQRLAAPVHRDE